MKKETFSLTIKRLRKQKGMSQELLAENTGLSLRTIQRIENGETTPRGDSQKRIAEALGTSIDEMMKIRKGEDINYLVWMNLSALGFILFPLLGILLPLIIWLIKHDKVKNIHMYAKGILNAQITWLFLFSFPYLLIYLVNYTQVEVHANSFVSNYGFLITILYYLFLYLFNITLIILNTLNIAKRRELKYLISIKVI